MGQKIVLPFKENFSLETAAIMWGETLEFEIIKCAPCKISYKCCIIFKVSDILKRTSKIVKIKIEIMPKINRNIKKDIGNRLKEFRKHLGKRQGEFAQLIGTTNVSVSNIERGISLIGPENLLGLVKKTRINLYWLLNGEPPMMRVEEDEDEKEMLSSVRNNPFLRDIFRILKDNPEAILVVSELVTTARSYDRMLDAIKEYVKKRAEQVRSESLKAA